MNIKPYFAFVLLVVGCSAGSDPGPSKAFEQIDAPNCVTELEPAPTQCDQEHNLVVRCGTPQACSDYRRCVEPKDGTPYGLVWCCTLADPAKP